MRIKQYIEIVSAAILLCGCIANSAFATETNAVQKAAKPAKNVLPLAQRLPPLPPKPKPKPVPPNRILARVNGVDITRAKLDRHIDFMVALLKNKNPKVDAKRIKAFKSKNLKRFSNELLLRTLLSTSLAHSNIVVSAEMRRDVEQGFMRNYGTKKQTFAQLGQVLATAGFSKDLEENLAFEGMFKTFVTTVYSNRYYVSDAVVKKYRDRVDNFNKVAIATNELNRALARTALERAKKGENFAKLADELSQDPDKRPGGFVGQCDENDFADAKHVWMALSPLKSGGITDVIDLEDGFAIYRVDSRKAAEESESGFESLALSRIFFRRAYTFPAQSDAAFREDVEKELRDALFKEIVKKFRALSKIEHPEGVTQTYQ